MAQESWKQDYNSVVKAKYYIYFDVVQNIGTIC